jgi:16S rRNA (uracil1498-N3)-methyltransferase
MNLPFFFREKLDATNSLLVLDEDTSKHMVQVLRMKKGELVQLTNGAGYLLTAEIVKDHKKACEVKVIDSLIAFQSPQRVAIGISLLKNTSRFEWFLEKATEIGVSEIIPLICERTEKHHFRYDRMKNLCISAMIQSQQLWMPKLHEPVLFNSLFENLSYQNKFIAHCSDAEKRSLHKQINDNSSSSIILIGPEGDFSNDEIDIAVNRQFVAVSLGKTRLRTETAGVVAAAILCAS